ncbi:uncharacterized protein LOC123501919 [Portunus trituberculatus]|uniref:uncharacterized protein LOC123501919 n=1 Tax=Portunus trituberculatus TaxID=210409 RepID=UPI001E1CDDBB|nr:uncharacterized protein LOC123501919 [Portunus trituberculatus]
MQTWARISTLLLLVLPFLLVLTPAAEAHGSVKVGCLNYGHSCLGAHGKRGSWPPAAPRTQTAAALLAPFLQGLAAPRNAVRSWQDKVMSQRRQQEKEQQQPQQQQQHHQEDFPVMYEDSPLPRIPAARHNALPANQDTSLDDDDLVYYGTYEEDYGDHRAKRSVTEKTEKQKTTPTKVSMSCLLFSRRC